MAECASNSIILLHCIDGKDKAMSGNVWCGVGMIIMLKRIEARRHGNRCEDVIRSMRGTSQYGHIVRS